MTVHCEACKVHKCQSLCIISFTSRLLTPSSNRPTIRNLYTTLFSKRSTSSTILGKFSLSASDLIFYYIELCHLRRSLVLELDSQERAVERMSSLLIGVKILTDNEFINIHQIKTKIFGMLLQEAESKRQSECTKLQSTLYDMETEHTRLLNLQECIKESYDVQYLSYKQERARLAEIDRCLLVLEKDMLYTS